MSDPSFVHVLPSGVEPTEDPVGPHPLELAEIEQRVREIELSRAAAVISSSTYMVDGA